MELLYAKALQWLWLNTKLNWGCPECRRGKRVERRGFLHFVHPKGEEWTRCREPSWWIMSEHRHKKSAESKTNPK